MSVREVTRYVTQGCQFSYMSSLAKKLCDVDHITEISSFHDTISIPYIRLDAVRECPTYRPTAKMRALFDKVQQVSIRPINLPDERLLRKLAWYECNRSIFVYLFIAVIIIFILNVPHSGSFIHSIFISLVVRIDRTEGYNNPPSSKIHGILKVKWLIHPVCSPQLSAMYLR